MFEVWSSEEDPMLRLVLEDAGAIPPELASRDWSHLGRCSVPDGIAKQVRDKGFALVRSSAPFRQGAMLQAEPGPALSPGGVNLEAGPPRH